MKRLITLLLVLVMALPLTACGGGQTAEGSGETQTTGEAPSSSNAEGLWSIQKRQDEFGDVIEDSDAVLVAPFIGDFSNTATTSSELTGKVIIQKNPNVNHYLAEFELLEYGRTKATYMDNDPIVLKTKVGDTVNEYSLQGEAPNGNLLFGAQQYEYTADRLYNTLYSGEDVRCIIEIGNSQYNFTIQSSNFLALCNELGFQSAPGKLTAKEAVSIILADGGTGIRDKVWEGSAEWVNDLEILDSTAIENYLNGYLLEIRFGTVKPVDGKYEFPQYCICKCSPGTTQYIAEYAIDTLVYETAKESGVVNPNLITRKYRELNGSPLTVSIENNTLTEAATTNTVEVHISQLRKITDNIMVKCFKNDEGFFIPHTLVMPCEGTSMEDVYNAITHAIEYDLPQIP